MGYKLTAKMVEKLKRSFNNCAIDKINDTLAEREQDERNTVRITININFDDLTKVMSEVTFIFYKGIEVLPLQHLELNKWLPIEKIDYSVIDENVIFKDKSGELTLHNVAKLTGTKSTILCNIDDTWHCLDNKTHFMIFEQ